MSNWRQESTKLVIHKEVKTLAQKMKENFTTLAISFFALAAALSWNEVLRHAIDILFPSRTGFSIQISIAIMFTIVSVIVTYAISKMKNGK